MEYYIVYIYDCKEIRMKAALIGYGKMGRLLETRLLEKGHEILAVVDPNYKEGKELASLGGLGLDVAIEYTSPATAVENILFCAKEKIPLVTGTTGWYDRLPEVEKAVNAAGASLLWASNFSLGVNLFYRIAAYAAKLIDPFADYDVGGFEIHHNKKADSPSGTAKVLAERVLAQMSRKKKAVYEMLEKPPAADELHYASLRVGSVPGTHSLVFDSVADTIEISHSARSREGFAAGTVLAAEWLAGVLSGGKKQSGVFTIDDVLKELL